MRYSFRDLFEDTGHGRLTARRSLAADGRVLRAGAPVPADGTLGGLAVGDGLGHDLEGRERRGVVVLYGYYQHALLVSARPARPASTAPAPP